MPAGTPSTMIVRAGPWDSPAVVKRCMAPKIYGPAPQGWGENPAGASKWAPRDVQRVLRVSGVRAVVRGGQVAHDGTAGGAYLYSAASLRALYAFTTPPLTHSSANGTLGPLPGVVTACSTLVTDFMRMSFTCTAVSPG